MTYQSPLIIVKKEVRISKLAQNGGTSIEILGGEKLWVWFWKSAKNYIKRSETLGVLTPVSRIWKTGRWWWRRCNAALSRSAALPLTRLGVHLDKFHLQPRIPLFGSIWISDTMAFFATWKKKQGFWAHRLYGPPLVCKVFFVTVSVRPKIYPAAWHGVLAKLEAKQRSSRSKRILFPWPDSDEFCCAPVSYFVLSTNFQYMDDILC